MRVAVFGGTRFIGRAIVDELAANHDRVLVVHRGETEPPDLAAVEHLHMARQEMPARRSELAAFNAEAFIDAYALSASDADLALRAIHGGARIIALSSADVYRAYEGLRDGALVESAPLTEGSPIRDSRFPHRGKIDGAEDYEKLDVEAAYAKRGATILRLPFVYGEHDYQRREEFVLGRIRAGRTRMPFGRGRLRLTRAYARDIARAVRLALACPTASGEVFNLGEPGALTMRELAEAITRAAGAELEFVEVPDDKLPHDLRLTGDVPQDLVLDVTKARELLGWSSSAWDVSLKSTVQWHLANPVDVDGDFSDDDAALEV
jgi:UDP-glucose 4-epimerase